MNEYWPCHCGGHCDYLHNSNPDELCWGGVECVGEEEWLDESGQIVETSWIHACEGHFELQFGGKYEPKKYL